MKNVVVRNIERADAKALATFEKLGASTVHEALGRYQLMKPYMRPVWAGASIAGPAVTVLAQPGDNWMLHVAIEQCKPGDVVVLGCTADNTDGMIGDLIATSLKARGVKGVVMDAGCRDVAALKEMGFPIWSRAISSKGSRVSSNVICCSPPGTATSLVTGANPNSSTRIVQLPSLRSVNRKRPSWFVDVASFRSP